MKVDFGHLQLLREIELRSTVEQIVDDLDFDLEASFRAAEHQHYQLVQHAFDVTRLADVSALIDTVKERTNLDLDVQIFVAQMPVAQASTFGRGYFGRDGTQEQAVVIVSQHFFNSLEFDEQVAVLGHELGHIAFGHGRLPVNAMLQSSSKAINQLRPILSEYSTCCEVSCDLAATVATGGEWLPVASSLIRMQTGLNQGFIDSNRGLSEVLTALTKQLDDLHLNHLQAQMGSHPITPARLEMLERFSQNELVQSFGAELAKPAVDIARSTLVKEFRDVIGSIYWPALDPTELSFEHREILGRLAVAVALADDRFEADGVEARALSAMLGAQLIGRVLSEGHDSATLLAKARQLTKAADMKPPDAVRLVRYAAVVAAVMVWTVASLKYFLRSARTSR